MLSGGSWNAIPEGRFLPGRKTGGPKNSVPYSPELAEAILDWLIEGKTLKSFGEQPGTPSRKFVYEWVDQDRDGFAGRYESARRWQMETWADEQDELAAAELGSNSMPAVQARKTQIHARQWLMERLHPTAYGQRVAYEHRGGASVVVMLPDNGRMAGDNARVIDGQARELLESGKGEDS